jgi:hypothetical protein
MGLIYQSRGFSDVSAPHLPVLRRSNLQAAFLGPALILRSVGLGVGLGWSWYPPQLTSHSRRINTAIGLCWIEDRGRIDPKNGLYLARRVQPPVIGVHKPSADLCRYAPMQPHPSLLMVPCLVWRARLENQGLKGAVPRCRYVWMRERCVSHSVLQGVCTLCTT